MWIYFINRIMFDAQYEYIVETNSFRNQVFSFEFLFH